MAVPRISLVFAVWTWIAAVNSAASANEPSSARLIKLAPTITSTDGKCREIKITGVLNDDYSHLRLAFRARYRAPGQYAMSITDDSDGTPLILFRDGEVLMYNGVENIIVYSKGFGAGVLLNMVDDTLKCSVRCSKIEQGRSGFFIDLPSLYGGRAKSDQVTSADARTFRLTRTSERDNSLVAYVDQSRRSPFRRVELIWKGEQEPAVCLQEIAVDEDVRDPWPAPLPKDRLAKSFVLMDWSRDRELENSRSMDFMTRVYEFHRAKYDPYHRQDIEKHYVTKIDWKSSEKNDRTYSQALKEIFGPDFIWP